MQISSKGKYSVRALVDIAQHSRGEPVPLAGISQREGISLLFLEQLFQQLRKADLVKSVRGPHGGYVLARDSAQITVGDVVKTVEAPLYTSSCFSKTETVDQCRIADSCVSGALWKQLSEHVETFLDSVTIADLCKPKPEVVYHLRVKSNRIEADRRAKVLSPEAEAVEVLAGSGD
jgi:Rrf2 family iron-sulfur cluster assembly transcriptional regulator